jgi:ectoine hydroxylase
MKLTKEQLEQFDREGYLFFPGLFTPEETKNLNEAVPELYSRREAYNVREKGSDAVRTNFAAHMISEPFAKLARHPRMVEPVEELFGEKLYMHQFKINGKMAFEGDVWQWHQDYGTWLNDAYRARHERRDFSRRCNRIQRSVNVHSWKPQKRGCRCQA